MFDWIARSRKAIAAVAGTAVVAYFTANEDGKITTEEWGLIAGALVVGIITYVVKNRPKRDDEATAAARKAWQRP